MMNVVLRETLARYRRQGCPGTIPSNPAVVPERRGNRRKAGTAYGRSCGALHCQWRRSERNPMREYPGPLAYEKRNESAKEEHVSCLRYRKVRQRMLTSEAPGDSVLLARVSRGSQFLRKPSSWMGTIQGKYHESRPSRKCRC